MLRTILVPWPLYFLGTDLLPAVPSNCLLHYRADLCWSWLLPGLWAILLIPKAYCLTAVNQLTLGLPDCDYGGTSAPSRLWWAAPQYCRHWHSCFALIANTPIEGKHLCSVFQNLSHSSPCKQPRINIDVHGALCFKGVKSCHCLHAEQWYLFCIVSGEGSLELPPHELHYRGWDYFSPSWGKNDLISFTRQNLMEQGDKFNLSFISHTRRLEKFTLKQHETFGPEGCGNRIGDLPLISFLYHFSQFSVPCFYHLAAPVRIYASSLQVTNH